MGVFEGFETRDVEVGSTTVHAVLGGGGPPVLLLHGYPQTHVMWHHLARALADTHTVVAADLRGYGDSGKPAGGARHEGYSKRAMAQDQVRLMSSLGFDQFAVLGHDRGARVAHRMCLDHPERVLRAAVLDIVPTRHLFSHVDRPTAQTYYHWFFLSQPADLPERLIGGAPEYYLRHTLRQWSANQDAFDSAAVEEYVRCFADPATIHATCEDYRAAATIDLDHDEVDAAAGNRVRCPLLVGWGSSGFVGTHFDVVDVWRRYADDVRPWQADCGHFVPEEAPHETAAALTAFLAG